MVHPKHPHPRHPGPDRPRLHVDERIAAVGMVALSIYILVILVVSRWTASQRYRIVPLRADDEESAPLLGERTPAILRQTDTDGREVEEV